MQDGIEIIDDENQEAEENNDFSSEGAVCNITNHSEKLMQIWKFSFSGTEDFSQVPITKVTNVLKAKTQHWEFLSFADADKSIYFLLNDSTVENFLKDWKFVHFPDNIRVNISVCKQERTVKGIIRDKSIKLYSTEELLEELSKQGVTKIHKIKKSTQDNRKRFFTDSLICEFKEKLPNQLILHGVTLSVGEFISRPLLCEKCGLLGHKKRRCRSTEEDTCKRCYRQHDQSRVCVVQCKNCGERGHETSDKSCPIFIREIEILKIKDNLNINYEGAINFLRLEEKNRLREVKRKLKEQIAELEQMVNNVEKESEGRVSKLQNEIEQLMKIATAVQMEQLNDFQSQLSRDHNDSKNKIKEVKDEISRLSTSLMKFSI